MGYKGTNKPEKQGNLIKPINSGAYITDNCKLYYTKNSSYNLSQTTLIYKQLYYFYSASERRVAVEKNVNTYVISCSKASARRFAPTENVELAMIAVGLPIYVLFLLEIGLIFRTHFL